LAILTTRKTWSKFIQWDVGEIGYDFWIGLSWLAIACILDSLSELRCVLLLQVGARTSC
jgi:hypothetical protein